MRVKVCGMTNVEQMHQLGDLGVSFAGMIFYHQSPRFVLKYLSGEQVRKARLKLFKVGVFVNADYDEIMNQVEQFDLDMVQLHGDETPRFCEQVSNSIQTIKAFRISREENILWKIRDYRDSCDMYLFDTMGSAYGGTGTKFDWGLLKGLEIARPYLLSGGIEPCDVDSIQSFAEQEVAKNLFAVDINSRFETAPGIKDMEKIKVFVAQLKN